ncbi:class I SAM-dependent DNA methyltransferase [Streptomyces hyaluromycini]|uniref:site-specific DNA-methyltransferase (adenine-specific) n=1 Tax=Streptomyces hyaluromycini TaxID=1377993 RepID=A0ABV1WLZ6_9ACTN
MSGARGAADALPNTDIAAGQLDQRELENYLWGAAVRLRGLIDAGDYKQFIFPLLFFKRICDVHDEEREQALVTYNGDAELVAKKENYQFQIPDGHHWAEVREARSALGSELAQAMKAIEMANPEQLWGVFGDAQWTNTERLSDATLRDLLEHFSTQVLSLARVPEDELGRGYEYLIKKFADDSGHTAQEFYTNRTLVRLMTRMLQPEPGETVYDPTCGTGGMLVTAAAELKRQGKEHRRLTLYGQEFNVMTSSIARMNLYLHGIENFHIERGDTLAEPLFFEGDQMQRFDVVLANPPYSIKQWNRPLFAKDPYRRNMWGVPPQGRADYAFFQHIAASLDPETGRCAILFPHGVLFREDERVMREKLIESDLLECVLGLGPGLFYNSPMEACVVVLRTRKQADREGKVLFIDAAHLFERARGQSFLSEQHIAEIYDVYDKFVEIEEFSAIRDNAALLKKGAMLAISYQVHRSSTGEQQGLGDLKKALGEWDSRAATQRSHLEEMVSRLGGYGG